MWFTVSAVWVNKVQWVEPKWWDTAVAMTYTWYQHGSICGSPAWIEENMMCLNANAENIAVSHMTALLWSLLHTALRLILYVHWMPLYCTVKGGYNRCLSALNLHSFWCSHRFQVMLITLWSWFCKLLTRSASSQWTSRHCTCMNMRSRWCLPKFSAQGFQIRL